MRGKSGRASGRDQSYLAVENENLEERVQQQDAVTQYTAGVQQDGLKPKKKRRINDC